MDASELYWLAGLLEGEGTFLAGPPSSAAVPFIRVEMTDQDVVEHVAVLIERRVHQHPPRTEQRKPSMSTTIKGAGAAHFMRLVRPLLGERRRRQVDRALARPHSERVRWVRRAEQCSAADCARPARTRGLCKQHYGSWWKACRQGQTSAFTPHGPLLPVATLVVPLPSDPGATPWLAGLLEGEGTFASKGGYPAISVNMCDRDVVARAAELMGIGETRVRERFIRGASCAGGAGHT